MLGWHAKRHHAGVARAHMFGDPLDGAVLAGGIAALDDDENLAAIGQHAPLHRAQGNLQLLQLMRIAVVVMVHRAGYSLLAQMRAMTAQAISCN